jgi:hypothetical protein
MKIIKPLILTGIIAGSYFTGKNLNEDQEYRIIRENQTITLESKILEKQYQIQQIEREIYLGDSEHNFKGARELMIYELDQNAGVLEILERETTYLPSIIKNNIQEKYQEFKNLFQKEEIKNE